MSAEGFDNNLLCPSFKPTKAFQRIVDGLEYAQSVGAPLALVTGAHGAGKTTAFRYYAQHKGAVMWECLPSYHEKYLMRDLVRHLGISAGMGWQVQTSIVTERLKANPRTFLLDEGQRLSYAGMDLLKYLADASGSTFALSASPSLERRIDRWPDISSRCTVRVRVDALDSEEFLKLYQAEGFTTEAVLELHHRCGGVMRVLQTLLQKIDAQPTARGDLTPAHIRLIAEGVSG